MDLQLPATGWSPRPYQLPFWERFQDPDRRRGGRYILCWHRRAGKDLTCIHAAAIASLERVGLYLHVFPYLNQGRKIVWNGRTGEGIPFLEAFPEQVVEKTHDMDMKLTLKNGSIYQVMGADDPDKLVGINPVGIILSEFGLFETDTVLRLIQPIVAENGGWIIFASTPRGKNHYFDLIHRVINNPNWFISILGADDTKSVSEEAIQEARDSGMPEPLIQQEFYVSFEAVLQGAYYEQEFNILADQDPPRISDKVIYDPTLVVNQCWDLGIDDEMVIWYFQIDNEGKNWFWFDLDHGSNQSIEYFAKLAAKKGSFGGWRWGHIYLPHDIKTKDMATNTQTRLNIFKEVFGFRPTIVDKHEVEDGIMTCRRVLLKSWINRTKCSDGIRGLKAYRREYDEKKQTFKKKRDDWASHYADSFRYGAVGASGKKLNGQRKRQQYALPSGEAPRQDSDRPGPGDVPKSLIKF